MTENLSEKGQTIRAATENEQLKKKLKASKILNVGLAFALVFVGGSYASLTLGGAGKAPANAVAEAVESGQNEVTAEMLAAEPYMVIGDVDAPVTLYEWTDFTCPFCGVFNRDTLPMIISEYIDTGKVKVEVHDVTYIGPQAEDAAVAARAAGLQDHYLEYLLAVYKLGENDNKPDLNPDTLFALADEVGLDINKFEKEFGSDNLRAEVQMSTQLAQSLGITGVPFFVIANTGSLENMVSLNGAQPIEQFRAALDEQIAKANI